MPGIIWDVALNIAEGAPADELVEVLVNLSILIIDLNLVERVLPHSSSVNNESTLSNTSYLILSSLIIIIVVARIIDGRKYGIWLADNFQRLEFAIVANRNKPPVIESTLPEFAKINANFLLDLVLSNNVSLFNLMPGQKVVIVTLDW